MQLSVVADRRPCSEIRRHDKKEEIYANAEAKEKLTGGFCCRGWPVRLNSQEILNGFSQQVENLDVDMTEMGFRYDGKSYSCVENIRFISYLLCSSAQFFANMFKCHYLPLFYTVPPCKIMEDSDI